MTIRSTFRTFPARLGILVAATAASALVLSACATSGASTLTAASPAGESITVTDAWVKSAESGMSAAFGELANDSDHDVTVVSATSAASDMLELHETVENESGALVMRQIEGGFVIPAGGALDLEPGGDHIMFMGLTAPLLAGADVSVTLTFSDDSTLVFTAPVKDYSGANETYEDGDMGDMGDTEMDGEH